MEDIGSLITLLLQAIFNAWNMLSNIEFLGTDLLTIMVGFVICNALISLFFTLNKTNVSSSKSARRKEAK